MVKVYCLAIPNAECEDLRFTLSEELALKWLEKHKKSSIIVYTITDDCLSDDWDDIWYYIGDNLKKDSEQRS